MATDLPSGTVTFLFTDIEGSTKLAQAHRDIWEALRARHHAILHACLEKHGGHVFEIIGDAFCAAFHTAGEALSAAVEAQRGLQTEAWGETPIRVRMGINTGAAWARSNADGSGGYTGFLTLARTQRVMATGYGGQILVSNTSADLLFDELPSDLSLRDMKHHRLKGLVNPEHLWQVVAPDLLQDFPALQTLNRIPNNLPIQLTSFIGREKEIAQIRILVEHNRLVTLTGSGGVGKTRHSVHAGAELLDAFTDGVWLVELASVSDPGLVPQAVATVLGVREDQGRPLMAALQDHLEGKSLFLILDSCEHLLDACARLADALLHSCPRLKILVSSREALGMAAEVSFRIPSLSLPDPRHLPALESLTQYDAVRLFIERAEAVKSGFVVTHENAHAVAQVCFRLDGIPLAIELAAARVKGLSVEQISQRLDDRFRLLTGGSRTALPRHQTLRAMIEWSFELLSEAERVLLRRLAVFVTNWTLEAAEAVCAQPGVAATTPDVIDPLLRLVDKSLVVAEEQGGQARYHMLETIRQFARDKLWESGEGPELRARHLEFFLQFSERAEGKARTAEHLIWLHQAQAEYEDLGAALEWAREGASLQPSLRLGKAMEHLADVKSLLGFGTQSIALYQQALDVWRAVAGAARMIEARLNGKILLTVAALKWRVDASQHEALRKIAAEANASLVAAMKSLEAEPPSLEQARLLTSLSTHAANTSIPPDWDLAEHYARTALGMAEKLGSLVDVSEALGVLADSYLWRNLIREGLEVLKRRLLVSGEPGFRDLRERTLALIDASFALMGVGEYVEALPHLLEAERLGRQIQAPDLEKAALDYRIHCLFRLDRWEEILSLDEQRSEMQRLYPLEQIGVSCFEIALIASIHAMRGELSLAVSGREEASTIMTAHAGEFQHWDRVQHY